MALCPPGHAPSYRTAKRIFQNQTLSSTPRCVRAALCGLPRPGLQPHLHDAPGTPTRLHQRGSWQCHQSIHCLRTPAQSDAQLHHFPTTPEQRTPAVLPPGTAHTSLWGWHRESFLALVFTHLSCHCEVFAGSDPPQPGPHLTPGGVRLRAWCLCAGRARSFCRGGIWRPPREGRWHL